MSGSGQRFQIVGSTSCFDGMIGGELVDSGQLWCSDDSPLLSIPLTVLKDLVIGTATTGVTEIPLSFGPNFFLTFDPKAWKGSTSSTFIWKYTAGGRAVDAFRLDLSRLTPDQLAQPFNKGPLGSYGGQIPPELLHFNQKGMYRFFKVANHQIVDPLSQRGWFWAHNAARYFRYSSKGFLVASVGFAAYDVMVAENIPREIVAQVSGFVAARQGCKLLAPRAGAVLAETGPGALAAAAAGCLVGGGIGYGIGTFFGRTSYTVMEAAWARVPSWSMDAAVRFTSR